MIKLRSIPATQTLLTLTLLGISVLLAINLTLYVKGQTVQREVHANAEIEAQKELFAAIDNTLQMIDLQLTKLAEWDEVHQQLQQPSYYFYWRDQRIKESLYYQAYYEQLELYSADKFKLSHLKNPSANVTGLTDTLPSVSRFFLIQPPNKDLFIAIKPVYDRAQPHGLLGYVAISVDFYTALRHHNQFYYLNIQELHFNRSGLIQMHQLNEVIEFKAISNPVSDHLWQLIQQFVFQLSAFSLFAALIIIWLLSLLFIWPLRSLSHYLSRLRQQPNQTITAPKHTFIIEEFESLKNQLADYHQALIQAQTDLNEKNTQLWQLSRQDPLTNVLNRRAFDEAWKTLLQNHVQTPNNVGYLILDCDHFKALNDSYGHQTGDEIIKAAAKTLQHSLPKGLSLYRIGGDEFAILLKDYTPNQIEQLAQKCLADLLAYPFQQLDVKEKISFSIGISYANKQQPVEHLAVLPRQADISMYKAKHSPYSKIHFYQHEVDTDSQSLVSSQILNQVLAAAHTGQGICLHYQPICHLVSNECYFEALVRLTNEQQLIYPLDIFTIIAHHRLEVEFDQKVLKQLLQDLRNQVLKPGQGVSVNLSGKTLLQPFLVDLFEPFLPFLTQHKIVIEITETVLIDHFNEVSVTLNKLRRQGFLIALDDFGSGYSSIRYLAHMPVDIIKFDLSLTHSLNSDDKTKHIIEATANMIRQAGYELVMEGIETPLLLDLAKQAGATYIQGYLMGKPNIQPQTPGLVA